jgi:rRNA maturation RNase YbeY
MSSNNIYFHNQTDFDFDNKESRREWIENTIREEGKQLGEINIIFCDDNSLLEKNKTYLNHNTLTDIITFDYSELNTISGDIFISIERVLENSKDFKVTFDHELNRVIIHGHLHLVGYKDKTEEEQRVMREKEDYYLLKIN